MEELNKASETLGKLESDKFRIMLMPPTTLARADYNRLGLGDELSSRERSKVVVDAIKKFINDVDLFHVKPDARFFGELWHDGHTEQGDYYLNVSIPDDMEVPAPLKKERFKGGLYVTGKGEDTWNFLENNPNYEWAPTVGPITHEYYNLWNRLGLKHGYYEELGFSYLELIIHIRQIKTFTEAEKIAINARIEESVSNGKVTEINLSEMKNHDDGEFRFINGLLSIGNGANTPQIFSLPLKIDFRAKTDNENIMLKFAKGGIIFNDSNIRGMLGVFDLLSNDPHFYNSADVPPDEFADIEWILDREAMIVKVNGELRYFSPNHDYIAAFAADPGYKLSSEVVVGTWNGSTVTVESLRVIEL